MAFPRSSAPSPLGGAPGSAGGTRAGGSLESIVSTATAFALRAAQAGAAAFALVLVASAPAPAVITGVDEADDICPPAADPCVIDQEIQFAPGAVVDFGTRDVEVVAGGLLNSADDSVVLRCGDFTTTVGSTSTAIEARNNAGGGGSFTLEARRTCSANPDQLCFSDAGCDGGTCSAHLCSADASVSCQLSSDCNLGQCQGGRCSASFSRLCNDDLDCQLGPCDTGSTVCSENISRACSNDGQCDDGVCSVGSGSVSIDGRIFAQGSDNGGAGAVVVTAADDVLTSGVINMEGNNPDNDGGLLELESGLGSVTLAGRINGVSGRDGTGGDVVMTAALDVIVDATVDVNGGDFDGGTVELTAGRDIVVGADLLARSDAGEGFGGSVTCDAGRDLAIGAGVQITTNGHESGDGFCGDGGPQAYDALGNMSVGAGARLEANGAAPDCAGESLSINVGGDLSASGALQSRANGLDGIGGRVDITAAGDITLTSQSMVDASGGTAGAGVIEISSGNDVAAGGLLDSRAEIGGASGNVTIFASRSATISGSVMIDGIVIPGSGAGTLNADACSLTVAPTGQISNVGTNGRNEFIGRRDITVEAGSQVLADIGTGTNRFEYREATMPPVLDGTISPTAQTVLNEQLEGCFLCGNGDLDEGETCDDGSSAWESGEFCGMSCQVLACGDPDDSGDVRATDALIVLNTAVGISTCDACICNVDDSSGAVAVTATDALNVLAFAVGLPRDLVCPACMP